MTDNIKNNKNETLSDNQLERVSGGGHFEKGEDNRVYSLDTPLHKIGDKLYIVYNRGLFKTRAICDCIVVSVSDEKHGRVWEEFTYSVEITYAPADALEIDPTLVGQIVNDVFESALLKTV